MDVLALITARGGSVTLPRKNILPYDSSVERFAVVEYELTGGQMFDSNQVILLGCP